MGITGPCSREAGPQGLGEKLVTGHQDKKWRLNHLVAWRGSWASGLAGSGLLPGAQPLPSSCPHPPPQALAVRGVRSLPAQEKLSKGY